MKRVLLMFLLPALITSCSYHIVRNNYKYYDGEERASGVVFTRQLPVTDSLIKVGEINLEESGYSIICSENEALRLLRNEARVVNAKIINIVSEKRPGISGSCYQCKAVFYKFAYPGMKIEEDDYYKGKQLRKRRRRDRITIGGVIVLGMIAGLYLGYRYY